MLANISAQLMGTHTDDWNKHDSDEEVAEYRQNLTWPIVTEAFHLVVVRDVEEVDDQKEHDKHAHVKAHNVDFACYHL